MKGTLAKRKRNEIAREHRGGLGGGGRGREAGVLKRWERSAGAKVVEAEES